MLPDFLRPILSRILAPILVWVAAWLTAKFGFAFTEDQVKATSELVIAVILYGVFHKWIDSKINSHDTASITATKDTKGAP